MPPSALNRCASARGARPLFFTPPPRCARVQPPGPVATHELPAQPPPVVSLPRPPALQRDRKSAGPALCAQTQAQLCLPVTCTDPSAPLPSAWALSQPEGLSGLPDAHTSLAPRVLSLTPASGRPQFSGSQCVAATPRESPPCMPGSRRAVQGQGRERAVMGGVGWGVGAPSRPWDPLGEISQKQWRLSPRISVSGETVQLPRRRSWLCGGAHSG